MKRRLRFFLTVFAFVASSIPSAFAADTSPPQLVDWAPTSYKVDISKADAIVVVRFILSDDSDITSPNLLLKSLSSTQMT